MDFVQAWAGKNKLPLSSDKCPKCGIERVANIPFHKHGVTGLESKIHECGEAYQLRVFRLSPEQMDILAPQDT